MATFLQPTPENYCPYVTHFIVFNNEFADFLKQFDIVFNVYCGFRDAGQADIACWLDSQEINRVTRAFEIQILAKDKTNLPQIYDKIGLKAPQIVSLSNITNANFVRFIAKPRMGSLHLNMLVFEKNDIPHQELLG